MTPTEHAVIQQALEALEEYRDTQMIKAPRRAITALREAQAGDILSPTEQAQQESVAERKAQVNELIKESARLIASISDEGDRYLTAIDTLRNAYRLGLKDAAPVQQVKQEPGEWINEDELPDFYPYDDMYQSSKVINGVRMFPNVKVSDRSMFYALTKDHTWISVTETQFNKLKPEYRMKCYAAPVRTKDLTDAFINELHKDAQDPISFARAVIAADREKNKCQH